MFGLGVTELVIIGLIVVFLFGAKKLPDLARAVGQSLGEFKKGRQDAETLKVNATEVKQVEKNSEKQSDRPS
jgi:sec-independent protein translocase protein TatA